MEVAVAVLAFSAGGLVALATSRLVLGLVLDRVQLTRTQSSLGLEVEGRALGALQ